VVSRGEISIAKNPSPGEGQKAAVLIARQALDLRSKQWYPVRIEFKGKQATIQVNDVVLKGSHAVLGEPKTALNFLVFGETAGIRNVKAVK
jgi:arylsulfatase A